MNWSHKQNQDSSIAHQHVLCQNESCRQYLYPSFSQPPSPPCLPCVLSDAARPLVSFLHSFRILRIQVEVIHRMATCRARSPVLWASCRYKHSLQFFFKPVISGRQMVDPSMLAKQSKQLHMLRLLKLSKLGAGPLLLWILKVYCFSNSLTILPEVSNQQGQLMPWLGRLQGERRQDLSKQAAEHKWS